MSQISTFFHSALDSSSSVGRPTEVCSDPHGNAASNLTTLNQPITPTGSEQNLAPVHVPPPPSNDGAVHSSAILLYWDCGREDLANCTAPRPRWHGGDDGQDDAKRCAGYPVAELVNLDEGVLQFRFRHASGLVRRLATYGLSGCLQFPVTPEPAMDDVTGASN